LNTPTVPAQEHFSALGALHPPYPCELTGLTPLAVPLLYRPRLTPEEVPAYLEFARAELGEQIAIYLRPQRWLSADLGPG
jgi:hypothetical protein